MLATQYPNLLSSHLVCLVSEKELSFRKQFVGKEVKTFPSFSNKDELWPYSVEILNSFKESKLFLLENHEMSIQNSITLISTASSLY